MKFKGGAKLRISRTRATSRASSRGAEFHWGRADARARASARAKARARPRARAKAYRPPPIPYLTLAPVPCIQPPIPYLTLAPIPYVLIKSPLESCAGGRPARGAGRPGGLPGVAGVAGCTYSIIVANRHFCYPSRFSPAKEGGPRAGGGAVYRSDPAVVAKHPTAAHGDPSG